MRMKKHSSRLSGVEKYESYGHTKGVCQTKWHATCLSNSDAHELLNVYKKGQAEEQAA